MIDALPLLLGPEGYQISRSVRLRSNTGYLNRTLSASGSTSQWTYSTWTKRGTLGSFNVLLSSCITGSTYFQSVLAFDSSDRLWYYQFSNGSSYAVNVTSTAVFRDPSAWYHVVMKFDATTSSMIVWVNNQQVINSSSFSTTNRLINSNNVHYIGNYAYQTVDPGEYDGYFTEINFIDGQALTPASFGETDAVTGVWKPKKYTGTYGTNGFYLNFSDNSAATAAAIGKDYSGNSNNWTPNNISLTAGVTYDSMIDVPTQWADGGNGRGNYCTGNPLLTYNGGGGAVMALKNGNLDFERGGAGWAMAGSTIAVSTGKWYWEATVVKTGSADGVLGIHKTNTTLFQILGYSGDPNGYGYAVNGMKLNNSTGVAYGASYTNGDVIGVALDLDAGTLVFYKNNASQGTAFSSLSGEFFPAFSSDNGTGTGYFRANFGQRPFAYTPPTGFKALNTLNLPTPTILKGNQYFDVVTRNGSSGPYTTTIDLTQGAMLWDKTRSAVGNHNLVDSVRGISKLIQSNNTNAEGTDATFITAFNNKSYTTGAGDYGSGTTLVDWIWQKGATQGFDIVTYTGNGGTQNISHNLGVAPQMMIVKSRSTAQRWTVFHTSISNAYIYLNETFAADTANAALRFGNNSAVVQPTSSVFTIGNSVDVNQNTTTYVAYLFAAVAGYSSAFSYTGNGSTDGPFIFLGFRPRWIMWKKTNSSTNAPWVIVDTARSPYNLAREYLLPNASDAETSVDLIDILSNGFKWRGTAPGGNNSGDTYIGFAMAESPFKFSLGR
jgi:hypothetical protein